ncbi:E3 binding domain-containing protein [Thermus oshimai]|jgi:hypothetical protein|uniref:E3 binding domain-containing protein n=1 Tax=Thermus oshimai TaxID=56957 RepID=UPI0031FB00B4
MEEPKITPLARRLAEENGIDWRLLKGTGPDGTIVERDVLAFLAKVMAGEVDLPPAPEPAPPPPVPEADLRRAQEVLGREGVDLSEVLPTRPLTVEIREEELDLEPILLDDLEDLALEEPEPEPVLDAQPEPVLEEWEEDLLAQAAQEAREEGLEEDLAPVLASLEEEALPEPLLEELEDLGSLEEDLQQEVTPALGAVAPVPLPPVEAFRALRVFRRSVDLKAVEEAEEAFARAFGVPKTPLPFLLKAAERALAELELPLRPLLGCLQGEIPLGLKPEGPFLALFRGEGREEGEGLLCFFGEEEVHTGRPSLFLLPEGLLALSGMEGEVAKKLLERVALYLEHPVLLLA